MIAPLQFSEEYFLPEVRLGFTISSMMKRAWAAEMEVLRIVANICESNGIQYFADWGTLLGAVRHKGFIPWDDDIDICLRREEYNRLRTILPYALPEGFVIAGMYGSSKRLQDAAFVSQMRVIADETKWKFGEYMQYFHGFPYQRVGIDIFPIDYIPEDLETLQWQKEILTHGIFTLQRWDTYVAEGTLQQRISLLEQYCNVTISRDETIKNTIWKLMDAVSSLYTKEDTHQMAQYIFYLDEPQRVYDASWYDKVVMMPFEQLQIPVPWQYDKILTAMYGEYRVPSRGGADHTYPFYGTMEGALKEEICRIGFKGSVEDFCREVSSGRLIV